MIASQTQLAYFLINYDAATSTETKEKSVIDSDAERKEYSLKNYDATMTKEKPEIEKRTELLELLSSAEKSFEKLPVDERTLDLAAGLLYVRGTHVYDSANGNRPV